jgi:hypothetical protein
MLRTCTSSTGMQLTTLATLKAVMFGATATSTVEDDVLDAYITRASEAVQDYLGYPLYRAVYEETVPGGGDNALMLSRTPVTVVESVVDGEDELDSTGYVIEEPGAGLLRRDEGFPWTAAVGFELDSRPVPGSEQRRYTVVYEAGYTFAGSTTTSDSWLTYTTGRTMPYWPEQATLETAKSWYKKKAADGSVQSKSIGDLSITYGQSNMNEAMKLLPETALAVLLRHARSV